MESVKDSSSEPDEEGSEKIVCRCEEVTEGEIRESIRTYKLDTVAEVKRATRAGMGLCQGRSCEISIKRILSEETRRDISEISADSVRPPTIPVETGVIADVIRGGGGNEED
ncbi:(2Fe-2S)-binding protein [Candidatus Bipolaricaulota bacterium]|nr:(2Fe-2S)-binding protein [Candidatus Bipolaricaulota bacterium]